METGNDGRFYDWHYDYNRNGQLDSYELMNYQDDIIGDGGISSGSGRMSGPSGSGLNSLLYIFLLLLMMGLFVVGFLLMIIFPPIVAFFLFGE